MRRRRRALVYWAVTLALAVGSGATVARLFSEAEAAAARYGSLREVPVVVRAVQAGEVIHPEDVEQRSLPAAFVPDGEVAVDSVGRTAVVTLVPGEVVLANRVAPRGQRGAAALIPAGWRALAVPAGPGGRPRMKRGDRVDVLATFDPTGQAGAREPTVVVATAALVVDVDDEIDVVTVAVAAGDAPRLAFAIAAASVTLALRTE